MKTLDRYLQRARIAKAQRFVRKGDVVLDIGCADGAMFEKWRGFIKYGYGIEPELRNKIETDFYTLLPGPFPEALPPGVNCNAITMLAVLEHIQPEEQVLLPGRAHALLNEGGRVIITVPSPRVDDILDVLMRLHVIDGMEAEEHYGFEPAETERLFTAPLFRLLHKESFQLGLNNLFVFERT